MKMVKLNENTLLRMLADNQIKKSDIENYILSEIQNNSKSGDVKKSIKKFKQLAKNNFKKLEGSLRGAWLDGGYINICNKYTIYSFKDVDIICDMVDGDVETIDIDKMYPDDFKSWKTLEINYKEVNKQYLKYKNSTKENKDKYKHFKVIDEKGNILIGFNIQYIKDAVDLFDFEVDAIYFQNNISPIIILSKDSKNKGLVLPVKLKK